jgi:hypothetical protein
MKDMQIKAEQGNLTNQGNMGHSINPAAQQGMLQGNGNRSRSSMGRHNMGILPELVMAMTGRDQNQIDVTTMICYNAGSTGTGLKVALMPRTLTW